MTAIKSAKIVYLDRMEEKYNISISEIKEFQNKAPKEKSDFDKKKIIKLTGEI